MPAIVGRVVLVALLGCAAPGIARGDERWTENGKAGFATTVTEPASDHVGPITRAAQTALQREARTPLRPQVGAAAGHGSPTRRRVLGLRPTVFGALTGAVVGGAAAFGAWGAEGTFVGLYVGGGAGALLGWLASR